MSEHILIATDGSELSDRGLVKGLALAKALNARVTVVTMTPAYPMPIDMRGIGGVPHPDALAAYSDHQKAHADDILNAARQKALGAGVDIATLHVPDAHVADAILAAVQDKGATMVVMASHGRRGVGRLLLGSQTSEVLSHSKVPVLVVR